MKMLVNELIAEIGCDKISKRAELMRACFAKVFVPFYGERRWMAQDKENSIRITFGVQGLLYYFEKISRLIPADHDFKGYLGKDDEAVLESLSGWLIYNVEQGRSGALKYEHYKMMGSHPAFQVIFYHQWVEMMNKVEFVECMDLEVGDTVVDVSGFPLTVIGIDGNKYSFKDQLLTGRPIAQVRKKRTDGVYKVFGDPPKKPIHKAKLKFK